MNMGEAEKYHVLARGIILSHNYLLVAHCIGMDNNSCREGMLNLILLDSYR